MSENLLNPTNDYVFKRLFADDSALLVALINDLRPDLPNITGADVLNPVITAEELSGKHIVLDVLARDAEGNHYNLEIQVRRHDAWRQRGVFYLARTLSQHLASGEDYTEVRAVVGLHLLDFDLFTATEAEQNQAVWRFELRDERQPAVSLGNVLQLNIIELKKADRLAADPGPGPIAAWVTFFKHWREDIIMANLEHEPVHRAMNRLHELSADEEARRLAFVRERALHDETSLLNTARREGREEGAKLTQRKTAKRLIATGLLSDQQIAASTELALDEVVALHTKSDH